MSIAHTYTTSLSAACKDVRAAEHNYKLFTLNCKLISTPPPLRDLETTIYAPHGAAMPGTLRSKTKDCDVPNCVIKHINTFTYYS